LLGGSYALDKIGYEALVDMVSGKFRVFLSFCEAIQQDIN